MAIGHRVRRLRNGVPPAAVAALSLFAAGCGSAPEYPPNLSFPSRTDRLVLKLPTNAPTAPNTPGKIVEELAQLDEAGGKTGDPLSLQQTTRTAVDQYLRDTFGTPAAPVIASGGEAAAERLGLTTAILNEGGRHFRKQCQQCHNLTGDGRGPAGLWVIPYPRDFRRGSFKFTTTGVEKPRRADLLRSLDVGLKGSAMPSFSALPEAERDQLVRFVTYLAIRGQVEFDTMAAAMGPTPPQDMPAFATERLKAVLGEWEKAENAQPLPGINSPPDDGEPGSPRHLEAVRRGYTLFTAKADNSCLSCHGDFGRKPVLRYDLWGTVAKPADLTANDVFKGGKQPEHTFARIRGGIAPVGMPAHPEMTDRQVWDLVRFVRSLPYPRELPDDVRAAVYPNP